jgi:hypothetical protein
MQESTQQGAQAGSVWLARFAFVGLVCVLQLYYLCCLGTILGLWLNP